MCYTKEMSASGYPTAPRVLPRLCPPLIWSSIVMALLLIACLLGLVIDPREVTGAPAWLKPAKFAISTAIYQLSLLWVLSQIQASSRFKLWTGSIVAVILFVEVAAITLQAARGRASHFNVTTPLDAAIFATMGIGISVVWAVHFVVTIAALRSSFDDSAVGWGLRSGMILSLVGSGLAGLMLSPTSEQRLAMREQREPQTRIGGHTVGGIDGGPGLPITRWSVEHGDLRVPHFFGLHALQILPVFAWLLPQAWPTRSRILVILVGAVAYALLLLLVTWQALQGYPVLNLGSGT